MNFRAGDKVRHVSKPSEPFALPNHMGVVVRVAPAASGTPAMTHVGWDGGDYYTWEKSAELVKA